MHKLFTLSDQVLLREAAKLELLSNEILLAQSNFEELHIEVTLSNVVEEFNNNDTIEQIDNNLILVYEMIFCFLFGLFVNASGS